MRDDRSERIDMRYFGNQNLARQILNKRCFGSRVRGEGIDGRSERIDMRYFENQNLAR
jgi:hypothetical protein